MSTSEKQMQVVGIDVWRGKAYLPTIARSESGKYLDMEPVYIADLTVSDLAKAIQAVKDTGHELVPDPKTRQELLAHESPILAATGARSWKELAQTGANYSIDWTENEIRIDMSRLDEEGRWESDPNKVRILLPDTPLEVVVEIILDDVKTRPEVFQ
jgi:hypothetical protein